MIAPIGPAYHGRCKRSKSGETDSGKPMSGKSRFIRCIGLARRNCTQQSPQRTGIEQLDFYHAGIFKLMPKWENCINILEKYVEKY
jgi:hypothetical protein